VEQRALDFLTFGLPPWLIRLEVALSSLLSSTAMIKFNAALVRTDLLTRDQAHESAIRASVKLRSDSGSWRTWPRSQVSTTGKDQRSHDPHPPHHLLPRHPGQQRRPDPGRPASPMGRRARMAGQGRLVTETFERGAPAGADPARVPLTATHPCDADTLPIGVTLWIEDRADAAWGEWRVSDTMIGDEVLALANDQVPLGPEHRVCRDARRVALVTRSQPA
jgi:hypothetical protein